MACRLTTQSHYPYLWQVFVANSLSSDENDNRLAFLSEQATSHYIMYKRLCPLGYLCVNMPQCVNISRSTFYHVFFRYACDINHKKMEKDFF